MTNNIDAAGIKFEDLGVVRNGKTILGHITADVPPGSATVVIGPNGAGKTTLLRCLLGEIDHTGKIIFYNSCGQDIKDIRIGYVPQQLQADAQLPLRVYEFLTLGMSGRPLWLGCSAKNKQRAKELLALVDAEKLLDRRLGDLSGGEMRRLLLAAALGRTPDLLVLDEAEAGVDYRGERLFWDLLDKSRSRFGFTLLIVTHNLPLAAHYATNVICVKKTLLAQGAPKDTLTAKNLLALFGVPIHLYPNQCEDAGPVCPECGAYGNLPYEDIMAYSDDDKREMQAAAK